MVLLKATWNWTVLERVGLGFSKATEKTCGGNCWPKDSRNGTKSAFPTTASPVPSGLAAFVGPVLEPHQLYCAWSAVVPVLLTPATELPVMAQLWTLVASPEAEAIP